MKLKNFLISDAPLPDAYSKPNASKTGRRRFEIYVNCGACTLAVPESKAFEIKRCEHFSCKRCIADHIMNSHDCFGQVRCPTRFCSNMLLPDEIFAFLGEANYDKFALSVVRLKERQERLTMQELQDKFNNDELKTKLHVPIVESDHESVPANKKIERTVRMLDVSVATGQSTSEAKRRRDSGENKSVDDVAGSIHQKLEESNTKSCQEDVETQQYIQSLIDSKEAMPCPRCGILVMKDDGCSFVTCAACELGICFLTQKPRHPIMLLNGRSIDGCHCMENGVKCHPDCTNCH